MRDKWRDQQHLNINDDSKGGGIEDLTDAELEEHEQRYRKIMDETGTEPDAEGKGEAQGKA